MLEIAAEAVDFDDTRDARQLALDDPVLNRAQLHRVIPILVTRCDIERILVYFAQPRGDGHHLRRTQFRGYFPRYGLYLFVDELPGVEDRDTFLKDDRYDRQSETRHGTNLLDVHDIAHRHLDGERDELLDFLRSQRRRDRHDLHLIVRNVGHGVHRKREHRIDTSRQQEERRKSDEEFFRDRKADYGMEHCTGKLMILTKIARHTRCCVEKMAKCPICRMNGPNEVVK